MQIDRADEKLVHVILALTVRVSSRWFFVA
jgi:hypothetical protein